MRRWKEELPPRKRTTSCVLHFAPCCSSSYKPLKPWEPRGFTAQRELPTNATKPDRNEKCSRRKRECPVQGEWQAKPGAMTCQYKPFQTHEVWRLWPVCL